jgi:tRNA (guanine37-N1)-methyltransferase
MVMKCEPIFAAVEALRTAATRVVLMSPGGRTLSHALAKQFVSETHLIILCGHYEGIDQRVLEHLVDDEISIGDYVLTNGAIAALIFVDCVVRLIPGVLGNEDSTREESHGEEGLLEYPQYTRPAEFRGQTVPEVLASGNHAHIEAWRKAQSIDRTAARRPDLVKKAGG